MLSPSELNRLEIESPSTMKIKMEFLKVRLNILLYVSPRKTYTYTYITYCSQRNLQVHEECPWNCNGMFGYVKLYKGGSAFIPPDGEGVV
jgi:hypothetical protein